MEQNTPFVAAGQNDPGNEKLLQSLTNLMYCVGANNNIGVWNGSKWVNCQCPWTVLDLVFHENECWIVGTEGNVGKLDLSNGTILKNYGLIGGWKIVSIDFDANGMLWCVGQNGNVGRWNGYSWDDQGILDGWVLRSISVRNVPALGLCWGVNTNGELGIYDFQKQGKWVNDFNVSGPYQSVGSTPPSSNSVLIGTVSAAVSNSIIFWNTGGKLAVVQTNWNLTAVAFKSLPNS